MSKSIFEKIIDREIPSRIIYEDEKFIAILDVSPKQKGHTLLIPKIKKENFLMESNETRNEMMAIIPKISDLLKKSLGATGIKLVLNNGSSSGQEVFHTHIHIIPYYDAKTEIEDNQIVFSKINSNKND